MDEQTYSLRKLIDAKIVEVEPGAAIAATTLTAAQLDAEADYFDGGYPWPQQAFAWAAWTESYVYVPTAVNGSLYVVAAPRNPPTPPLKPQ